MKPSAWLLAGTMALAACPALAQNRVQYTAPDGVNGVNVSAAAPLPVTVTPSSLSGAASTDASGTVTTGGTYQTVFASNTSRKGCLIQNPTTATEVLNVKVGTMSAPFTIPIGGSFNCRAGDLVVTDVITVTAPTTAHAFSAVSQ